ncbi:MAG: sensor domain-containing diguanylate cyclase [Actinoplanes sp.]
MTDLTAVQRIEKVVAAAGLTVAGAGFAVHASGLGPWKFQVAAYRGAAPVLTAVAAWLFWRTFLRAGRPGVRRYALLTGAALAVLTLSLTYGAGKMIADSDFSYPTEAPFAQVTTLLSLVLGLAGLLAVPVRAGWSTSRWRLGLDMATVLASGAIFLWYFLIQPKLDQHGALLPLIALAQTAGALVMLFAVARLALGGVAEVSGGALALSGAVGGTHVLLQLVTQEAADRSAGLRFALAGWTVLAALLIGVGLTLLRSTAVPVAAAPTVLRARPALLPYVAVLAAYVLLVTTLRRDGLDDRTWVVLGGAILLTGLVVIRQVMAMRDNARLVADLDESLQALRRSMDRERLLGDLGRALISATEQAEVHRLAVGAAAALLTGFPGARASIIAVTPEDPDHFLVVSSDAEAPFGGRLPEDAVPTELLVRLANGEIVTATGAAALGIPVPGDGPDRPVLLVPLVSGERFFGVLGVSTDRELPEDLQLSMRALGTQLSLGLDSVTLTAELTMRALHDALTGLGNRALLRDRLTASIARARRTGRPVGALLLDLNGFKQVNDGYGHDAGDDLLKVVANRLRACIRTEDTVGRLGGDEFVVIAEDLHSAQDAIVIAERIVEALNEVVPVGPHLLRTPASIGIALWNTEVNYPDELLRLADAAMYQAKHAGGGYHLHGSTNLPR